MKVLLLILGLLAGLWGLLIMAVAKGAVHEIQAYIAWLTAAVLFSGAGVIEAVDRLRAGLQASAALPTGGGHG